jgi:hypothetical protein
VRGCGVKGWGLGRGEEGGLEGGAAEGPRSPFSFWRRCRDGEGAGFEATAMKAQGRGWARGPAGREGRCVLEAGRPHLGAPLGGIRGSLKQ